MKIIYTDNEGSLSIVYPSDKEHIERILGPLTKKEYEAHIINTSVPKGKEYRMVIDDDIPNSREFRNAWCDVTEESKIDIDCNKAKEIKLEELRNKRNIELEGLDKQFIIALEKGEDLSLIKNKKQLLRDITEPLKALECASQFNDETLLNQIRNLSDLTALTGI